MVYEWDERRARRAYWSRVAVVAIIVLALVGAFAWTAAAVL
ncbi:MULTISPECIES: hypothetical protein [Pseudorhizobium]|jgi:hypothetical protein|uniref:Transmembrane protein n=3 Tax=Pseudorhizobium TaxID=1903858 RepID=L0NAG4_9HYPH|nr:MULTISPECIES: hypothetical protein [Pseudorhizobium]CAD6599708.1 hypothetical protein RNT25_00694 [arsenite-oxidising bacterium NT-25]CAD6604854.1 hypothetical protein RTCK_01614 [Rhizobium sp. TCK]MBB6179949.1 hypothetical protein [Pseudorhizobium flavum]CAD6598295.1 hypothetical protein RFYW14_00569 [Pseudorhizobium flavum]CAD7041725.1 hypothetical protein RHAB21_03211 [Pseudorhizobium halotolerans]